MIPLKFTLTVQQIIWTSCLLLHFGRGEITQHKFKAAVFEHAVIFPETQKEVVSREKALALMKRNLAVYEEQAAEAANKSVHIIVFPEDGIYGTSFTRKSIRPYLEFIPDPTVIHWTPCDDPTRFADTEVQYELSCMAKRNNLYVVANIGDIQPCHPENSADCPLDRHFQYNTDVAYSPSGQLVARYHKKNLFYEYQFNSPRIAEISSFDTPFGRWGMFTCFDVMFFEPAVTAIVRAGITNIAFPTAWMDALPLLASIQFHSAFARGLGVNFLAANIHFPQSRFQGSGIYTPYGSAAFYHNATVGSQPLLIIAELDALEKPGVVLGNARHNTSNEQLTSSTPQTRVFDTSKEFTSLASFERDSPTVESGPEVAFVSALFYDLFNFVQLEQREGTLYTCHNKLCCHLKYALSPSPEVSELFAFGAFDGLHTVEGQYYLQICALVRCANESRYSCGSPTNQSVTSFQYLSMNGSFETRYIYPEVLLTSDSNHLRLAEMDEWDFQNHDQAELTSKHGFSYPLLSAALFGRDYSRDDDDFFAEFGMDDVTNTAAERFLTQLLFTAAFISFIIVGQCVI